MVLWKLNAYLEERGWEVFPLQNANGGERFRRAVGYRGIRRTPLNAKSLVVRDYGSFRIEKAMVESAPGGFVPLLCAHIRLFDRRKRVLL